MAFHIRRANVQDAAALLQIYAPYVRNTTVTFEFEVPSTEEFAARIEHALAGYTWLVLEHAGGPSESESTVEAAPHAIGYAYYGPLGERAAYQWSAETSIYLDMDWCDRGLGAQLLEVLEACMAAQGICTSEACITSENTGSMEFHRRHGYTECARFSSCANKFNRWLSTVWMEKPLAAYGDNPHLVGPLDADALDAILAQANERLRQL